MEQNEEMKKWHVERTQTVLENRLQKLEVERTQIKSDAEDARKERTTLSKTLLSGASFAAPLILTLYAIEPLRYEILLVFVADAIFGLIMHKIHTSTSKKLSKLIHSTEAAYILAIEKLNYFRDYFDMDAYQLEITENKIAAFYNYHSFASYAVQVGLIKNLQDMMDCKAFETMRSDLGERLRDKKHMMKEGMKIYNSKKPLWDKNNIEWKMLRFVHEDFFKYHGYKIDEKTGEIVM